jgi:hypothetical protein
MEDWHFWVPTGISLVAVAFSAASWWHNLSAHSEQRSGEIIKLRSAVLQRLAKVEERLSEAIQGLRSARFDLRRLPDSHKSKYDWIEEVPALDKDSDDFRKTAEDLHWSIKRLPSDENSSGFLKMLRLAEHEIGVLEHGADRLTKIAGEQIEALNEYKRLREAEREARYAEIERLSSEEATRKLEAPKPD